MNSRKALTFTKLISWQVWQPLASRYAKNLRHVETVDPVVRDVAALDGSVDDVCVFHNTKFFKCSCMFSKIAAKVQFCASVVKSSAHFFSNSQADG